jgi:glucose/arabinose dehydrogenase
MPLAARFVIAVAAIAFAASGAAAAATGDWHDDAPGKVHRLSATDLPRPFATHSAFNAPRIVPRPADAVPKAPADVSVALFTDKLAAPRLIRVAPNGDIFVAESKEGRVVLLRPDADGGKPAHIATFAAGLEEPFGIAFYPPGPDPRYVYVADTDAVLRFPYRNGDMKAGGPPETLVRDLWSSGGHSTRDVTFSADGKHMFVSVGSGSNVADGLPDAPAGFIASHPLGAAWDNEANRADVLAFDPDGKGLHVYATGIRNCVTVSADPTTGTLYCATNERDGLGDNLVPDYVTSVRRGAFYGWPWFYYGDHPDPRHAGQRPDLADKITVPDVPIQSHSAPLQGVFYEGAMFPEWRGSIIVALHGSWNRATRTGGKVVRIIFKDGKPTGAYEDILTGFIVSNREVWGRPVGVGIDRAGAILVTDDGNHTLWRLTKK